jgi:CheY-like chemotaxis protein
MESSSECRRDDASLITPTFSGSVPGLDGLSVLSRIRSRFPDLPVVILSAHAESEATHRARQLGAADILTKPSALRDLTEVLRHFTSP